MTVKVLVTGNENIALNWNCLGATGFIGGQVLHDILQLKKYDVAAIVRDEPRAKKLEAETGVKAIVADLDSPNLADIASEYDVVLHTANADHPEGAKALIAGLEKRAANSERKPILIHTSGTGVLIDFEEPGGKVKSETIYSDEDLSTYHALPPTRVHKDVDTIVLEAGRRGKIDAIVVAPPTIWGTAQGVFNTHSIQVPMLIKGCHELGQGIVLEDGLNTWNIIHVADLSEAYLTILDAALNGKLPSDPNGRYFFVENGEYEQREVAEAVTKELYAKGKVKNPTPTKLTESDFDGTEENHKRLMRLTGTNSRSKAVLIRKLGWEAKRGGNKEFIESIPGEVDYVLQKSS